MKRCALILVWVTLVLPSLVFAKIEVFVSSQLLFPKRKNCSDTFIKISGPHPFSLEITDRADQKEQVEMTRQQVIDTYRELGTASEEYLEKMKRADDKFPPGSIIYIRMVNDNTGKAEGILRVVSGYPYGDYYFNHQASEISKKHKAELPMYNHYRGRKYRKFRELIKKNYPNSVEFGRLVFGKDVKRSRVMTDLFTTAIALTRFRPNGWTPQRHVLVEAVPQILDLVQAFPFKKVETPVALDEGRQFLVANVEEFYQKFFGNAARVSPENVEGGFKGVFEKVSESERLKDVYMNGYLQKANAHMQNQELGKMLPDVQKLITHDPDNRLYRLFELYAETGSRFNWYTGEGDWKEAIRFLDSPQSQFRYQNANLPAEVYEYYLTFQKGLVYLGAGELGQAKAMREEIEKRLNDRMAEAKRRGFISFIATPSIWAREQLYTYRKRLFDPETGEGDPQKALEEIKDAELYGTIGLSSELYAYKAQVLDALGRKEEAKKAREISNGLK